MIRINRRRKSTNGKVIKPPAAWRTSAVKATKETMKEKGAHEADSAIFSHDHVRAALEKLFHFKCAYCETALRHSGWPVDHFRPKGRIAGVTDPPGYYWLAYKWENLYPACTDCTEFRRDRPIWGDLKAGAVKGKADQFPLSDESTRAKKPSDSLRREKRLLLDPCADDPGRYLTFDVQGHVDSIGAVAIADGEDEHEVGVETIRVFHLDRRRLNRTRRIKVAEVVQALRLAQDGVKQKRGTQFGRLQKRLSMIFGRPENTYVAVAREVLANPVRFGV